MQFKKWMAALLAAVALVACGTPTVQPVARVDNVTLSQEEFDQRVGRIQQGVDAAQAQPGQPLPSKTEIEQRVVDLFITQNLTLGIAKEHGISVTDKEIDDRVAQFREQITASGGGDFDEVVQQQLGLPGGASSEFRQFTSFVLAQQKLAETLVTSDTIRQQVTDQVMAEANKPVEKATVAHILVETEDEANKVLERLNAGEDFAALAAELSKDPGSAQNGGVYENVLQGQMVPEFDKATFQDLQPGETTKTPVKTSFGYHIIKLISREQGPAMSEQEAQQAIAQQIDAQLQQERGLALSKLIDDERAKAKADGRLVEPDFPDPTAEPGVPAPGDTAPTTPAEAAPTTAP